MEQKKKPTGRKTRSRSQVIDPPPAREEPLVWVYRAFVRHVDQCYNAWTAHVVIAAGERGSQEFKINEWDRTGGQVISPYKAGDLMELTLRRIDNALPDHVMEVEAALLHGEGEHG